MVNCPKFSGTTGYVAGKQVYSGDSVQVNDTSVAGTNALTKVKVKWGDGVVSVIAPGGSATHAYSVTEA